jgi:hypothetical protein
MLTFGPPVDLATALSLHVDSKYFIRTSCAIYLGSRSTDLNPSTVSLLIWVVHEIGMSLFVLLSHLISSHGSLSHH